VPTENYYNSAATATMTLMTCSGSRFCLTGRTELKLHLAFGDQALGAMWGPAWCDVFCLACMSFARVR